MNITPRHRVLRRVILLGMVLLPCGLHAQSTPPATVVQPSPIETSAVAPQPAEQPVVAQPTVQPMARPIAKEICPPPTPLADRHVGLLLGIIPSAMVDVDYKNFYAFGTANLILPIATDGRMWSASLGAGTTFHIKATSRFKLDIYMHANTVKGIDFNTEGNSSEFTTAVGIGFGGHTTWPSGFTLGFKVPVLGYAFGPNIRSSSHNGGAYYYLTSLMSLPVFSIGYRF